MKKVWRLPIGILAALCCALAVLGCSFGTPDVDGIDGDNDAPPEGMVWVKVQLPKADARTLTADYSRGVIDYYEIFFMDRGLTDDAASFPAIDGSEEIKSAVAREGELLRVAVSPKHSYDILLLAGDYTNRILLASDFINDKAAMGYDQDGTGYPILEGKPNVIELSLTYIETVPKNDIVISSGALNWPGIPGTGVHNDMTVFAVDKGGDISNDVKVKIDITASLEPLVNALVSPKDLFVNPILSLTPYPAKGGSFATPSVTAVVDVTGKVTYTIDKTKWPDEDAYGRLFYGFGYYPFGLDTAGRRWTIRNGFETLSFDKGEGTRGASVLLKIGDPADSELEDVEIVINMN